MPKRPELESELPIAEGRVWSATFSAIMSFSRRDQLPVDQVIQGSLIAGADILGLLLNGKGIAAIDEDGNITYPSFDSHDLARELYPEDEGRAFDRYIIYTPSILSDLSIKVVMEKYYPSETEAFNKILLSALFVDRKFEEGKQVVAILEDGKTNGMNFTITEGQVSFHL